MKLRAFCIGLLLACNATQGMAEPCVSSTYDVPIPGALDVVTRHADIPSPKFPGLWQEGSLDGYSYALYANGEGILKSALDPSDWEIRVVCEADQEDCAVNTIGTPPENAQSVANTLSRCLQGRPLTPPEPQPSEPETSPTEVELPTEEPEVLQEEAVAPCGLATIPEGPEGMSLQRLLIAAGQDPGVVDGLVGRNTRNALAAVIGTEDAYEMEVSEAIDALDHWLCNPDEN